MAARMLSSAPAMNPLVRRWLDDASADPVGFWERAAQELPWFRRWDRAFEWSFPTFRWFIGAETNLAFNALDHHVAHGRAGHAALIYFNERGDRLVLTYAQLLHQVKRAAAALRGMGVRRGDRITLYMPTSLEAIVLMLAIVRIGAIHSIVFAGFGARALAHRIQASGSTIVFTADVTYRKGRDVPLKPLVDEAIQLLAQRPHVVTFSRHDRESWEEFLRSGDGHSTDCERMEANEPAFILATSGTTAQPKLAVHTHGGYQVHIVAMARWCYALKPDDVWWATSDIGWIVGHSYIVYAPLIVGCTSIVFEGALDYPAPAANWRTAIEEFGVTGMFTSPTAVRMLMRYGDDTLAGVDHSRVERIVCAGEALNPPAWHWLQNHTLGGRVPVLDHMWQTETAGPVFGNPLGVALLPIKPGSAGIPLAGVRAAVMRQDGTHCAPGEKGIMVLTHPFPGMTARLWGEPERYGRDYWERLPGVYYSGDSAHVDDEGYFWFAGRADEIIKIAAHRLGTVEVESAFLTHPAVAECGVVGRPDDTRGEVIAAFVLLKQGRVASDALRDELLATLRRELGALAVVGDLRFVRMLPKTRSGKIMRRVLKAVVLDRDPGDITTIEDEGSVEEARQAWSELRTALN
jgi:acetyl-CoA synthetase